MIVIIFEKGSEEVSFVMLELLLRSHTVGGQWLVDPRDPVGQCFSILAAWRCMVFNSEDNGCGGTIDGEEEEKKEEG